VSDIPSFNNSHQIIELIEKCWNRDSEKRPSIQQVIKKLASLYGEIELEKKIFNVEISDTDDSVEGKDYLLEETDMNIKVKWKDIVLDKRVLLLRILITLTQKFSIHISVLIFDRKRHVFQRLQGKMES